MKNHLIKGLLILAMIFVSVGTFSSCKDSNEDDLAKVESTQATLQAQIEALQTALNAIKSCDCYQITEQAWQSVQDAIAALQTATANGATKDELAALKQELENRLQEYYVLKSDFDSLQGQVTTLENLLNGISFGNLGSTEVTINGVTYNGGQLDQIIPALTEYINEIITNLQLTITSIQEDLTQIKTDLAQAQSDISSLSQTVSGLSDYVAGLMEQVELINTTILQLSNLITDLDERVTALESDVQKGIEAYNWMETAKNQIAALESGYSRLDSLSILDDRITSIQTDLQNQITSVKNSYDSLSTKLNTEVIRLDGRIDSLGTTVDSLVTNLNNVTSSLTSLTSRVEANEAAISELQKKLDTLTGVVDRLNKLVTSVIVQATDNPVFGTFAAPLGIQSNILMTFYGRAEPTYTFPSYTSVAEYDNEIVFTAQDIEMLKSAGNFTAMSVASGDDLLDTDEGNAGMVYLTINPNNVDFEGINVSLVNSQDEESGIKLSKIEKSDKVLTFGYTKSADNNGFYQAHATLAADQIQNVKMDIESGLQSAVVEVLKRDSSVKSNLSDVAALAQILYRQFNGILPANGIKVAWTADNGEGVQTDYAVYSNYNIAATAVKPLSFKFYYGQTTPSKLRLPIISPITGFEFDASKFTFDLDIDPITINGVELDFELSTISITDVGTITVTIQVPVDVDDDGNFIYEDRTFAADEESVAKFLKEIEDTFNTSIEGWNKEIQEQFDNAINSLVTQIQDQVNSIMDSISGQIDSQLKDLIENINEEIDNAIGGYINTTNNYINIYNSVANKINSYLENPNQYLQVMMCYKGVDGSYHQLSNSKTYPTVMNLAGGSATTLFPTTYSGETVAPSYKKFIGITNVWKTGDESTSAVNGDATCVSLLKEANNVGTLINKVITGKTHRVPFAVSTAGYTYEIVYSAMDYAGYTSSRKYYVSVK